MDVAEWPTLKPTLLFGQLPSYEDGDLFIVQSHAICRYLARKHDLQGSNEREHVRCDIVEEAFVDTLNSLGRLYWDPDFPRKRGEYEATTLPDLLGNC